ncbi:tripartite tricarboxylate transporter TctB family protein [Salipiger mucosus]|uniref:Tricarboxylate transport protein TctB n=1 Tax=Salipiger mucosus DSM 16094 TaxID=1123237 RepID=S9Q713_9RHOB|nr:tripartite tricarboxylate transporter TctB family protein [Salipiger mucosus]EPX75827.1 Tricarboxylate transport protein TctB [Salipiger mucosus DSM 16094]
MDPDFRGDSDHHDGTSDATPGGYAGQRRPGELAFALFLLAASLYLLWDAYGIAGFEALSSPGAVPMATTAAMVISALIVVLRTARLPKVATESVARDILPLKVILFGVLLLGFGLLLVPLGFLPTAALFLVVAIKYLSGRGWGFTLAVSLGSLLVIWVIFRIVFTVLMPAGIVPEAELLQFFRNLGNGGAE